VNGNEDQYKTVQAQKHADISLIIRGSLVQAQLGPLENEPLTIYFVGGFLFGASLAPGFEERLM